MSKCELEIEFEREDRTFHGGAPVRGVVRVVSNADVRCEALILRVRWQTHGRGNVDRGDVHEQVLLRGDLLSEEVRSLPFAFEAPVFPPTIRGRDVHVDHVVQVRMDVPWAFDPKAEEDYVVLWTSSPGDVFAAATKDSPGDVRDSLSRSSDKQAIILFAIGAFGLVLPVPVNFVVAGLGVGFGLRSLRRARTLRRLGTIEARATPVRVAVGARVRVEGRVRAAQITPVASVRAGLRASETYTSGSGTNRSTRTKVLFETEQVLYEGIVLQPTRALALEADLVVPADAPPSFSAPDNEILWQAWLTVDPVGLPAWRREWLLEVTPYDWSGVALEAASATEPLPPRSGELPPPFADREPGSPAPAGAGASASSPGEPAAAGASPGDRSDGPAPGDGAPGPGEGPGERGGDADGESAPSPPEVRGGGARAGGPPGRELASVDEASPGNGGGPPPGPAADPTGASGREALPDAPASGGRPVEDDVVPDAWTSPGAGAPAGSTLSDSAPPAETSLPQAPSMGGSEGVAAGGAPADDGSRRAPSAGAALGFAGLFAAIDALDRFGDERRRRITEAVGSEHELELTVERVNWTYGDVGAAYGRGRTLTGPLAGEDRRGPTVALRLPPDQNDTADALRRGTRVRTRARLATWNPTYGHPEFEAPALEVLGEP